MSGYAKTGHPADGRTRGDTGGLGHLRRVDGRWAIELPIDSDVSRLFYLTSKPKNRTLEPDELGHDDFGERRRIQRSVRVPRGHHRVQQWNRSLDGFIHELLDLLLKAHTRTLHGRDRRDG